MYGAVLLVNRSMLETHVEELKNWICKLRAQVDSLTTHVTTEQCTIQEQPFVPIPRYTVPVSACIMLLLIVVMFHCCTKPLNMNFLKPSPLKQPQTFNTTSASGDTPKLISVAPTDGKTMHAKCVHTIFDYCIIELSTGQRVKQLHDSVQRHAATNQKQMEIPSLLTTATHTTRKMLPVVANKANIGTIRRRIEYYSDDDDDNVDDTSIINDQHDSLNDDTLTINTPELQLPSPLVTPSSHDKAKPHSGIKLIYSPSPKDPQDILADKIASYVIASSDDSSPDPKVALKLLITCYLCYIPQLYYEATSTGKI